MGVFICLVGYCMPKPAQGLVHAHVGSALGDVDPGRVENGGTHGAGKGDQEAMFRALRMLHFVILFYFYHDFLPSSPIL